MHPTEILSLINTVVAEGANEIFLQLNRPIMYRKNGAIGTFQDGMGLPLSLPSNIGLTNLIPGLKLSECGSQMVKIENQPFSARVYNEGFVVLTPDLHGIAVLEDLDLSPAIEGFANLRRGLVIIAGPPKSGRTTTAHALIRAIAMKRSISLVTLEQKPSEALRFTLFDVVMLQGDIDDFSNDVDIVNDKFDVALIDVRDSDSVLYDALRAADNKLVIMTMNAPCSSVRVIDEITDRRVSDSLANDDYRTRLARVLEGIIIQNQVPRQEGQGLVPVVEVLIQTPAIANLIREHKSYRIVSAIQTGHKYGMNLFDEHLIALVRKGAITRETALAYAVLPDELDQHLNSLGAVKADGADSKPSVVQRDGTNGRGETVH